MLHLDNRWSWLRDPIASGAMAARLWIRNSFSALRIARLVILVCAAGATAHSQAPPEGPSTLPGVLVESPRAVLEQRVKIFVREVTETSGFSDHESLVRWNVPICFLAVGYGEEDGKTVSARLAQIASAAGAPLARQPCRANFVIVATSEPDRVLAAWYAKNSQLFGGAARSQIQRFLSGSRTRPVRVWRNIDRGRIATMRFGHFVASNNHAESSPFVRNAILGFFSVFAIIDTARARDLKLDQSSDYVAMAGLSNVDLDADFGSVSSILRLFAAPGGTQPPGLGSWDAAFLKALYQSDQTSRNQRFEIIQRMVSDLSR